MGHGLRFGLAFTALALAASAAPDAPASAHFARRGSFDVTAHACYAIPIIDLDFVSFGGAALAAGGSYAAVDGLLVGLRGRFDYLFLDTDSDLHAWIVDAEATLGWLAWRGLQPYLALGLTVVGDAYAGDTSHDPYFGAAVGLSYTLGPRRLAHALSGLEIGLEVAMMFHRDFRRTGTVAGTWNDGAFAYPLIYFGGRFSFAPGSTATEAGDDD